MVIILGKEKKIINLINGEQCTHCDPWGKGYYSGKVGLSQHDLS